MKTKKAEFIPTLSSVLPKYAPVRQLRYWSLLLLLPMLMLVAGCGSGSSVKVDNGKLTKAIMSYLKAHNMGMQVERIIEVKKDGEKGLVAKVSLSAADVPQVKVRWKFTFKQNQAGGYLITSHQQ